MTKYRSGFLAGVILTAIVFLTVGAVAVRYETKAVAYREGLKVTVNGEEVAFDETPMIVDPGWIMCQLEPVVKKMGGLVKWDDETSTLKITSMEYYLESILPKPTGQSQSPSVTPTQQKPSLSSTSSASEIAAFLNTNYGSVETQMGTLNLTYDVTANDISLFPYDYWVQMRYGNSMLFYDLAYKIGIDASAKSATIQALRSHAKRVYEVIHEAQPAKKIEGCYYDSWYRYPNIRVDLQTRMYLSWANYVEGDILAAGTTYDKARLTQFHWTPSLDDSQF